MREEGRRQVRGDITEGSHWGGTVCAHVRSPPGPESGPPTVSKLKVRPGKASLVSAAPPEHTVTLEEQVKHPKPEMPKQPMRP